MSEPPGNLRPWAWNWSNRCLIIIFSFLIIW
jgi:hypothetical protein